MDSQSFDRAGSTVVDHDDAHANRQGIPVITQGINYRWIRSSSRICSLSNIFLAALVLLSTTSYKPVMSASLSRHVRSTTGSITSFADAQEDAEEKLYDCRIDSGTACVLQLFRLRRFADSTVNPVNVVIENLPIALSTEEIVSQPLDALVPELHRQLIIYRDAFQKMKDDERHVDVGHFLEEFQTVLGYISVMVNYTEEYMVAHEFGALNIVYPEFEDTTNSFAFSSRSLHVLIKFQHILTQLGKAGNRF